MQLYIFSSFQVLSSAVLSLGFCLETFSLHVQAISFSLELFHWQYSYFCFISLAIFLLLLFWCRSLLLITCPSHLSLLCFISLAIFLLLLFWYRSLFLIFLGQKILFIFPRHLLWNTSIFFTSLLFTRQHSDQYNRTYTEMKKKRAL